MEDDNIMTSCCLLNSGNIKCNPTVVSYCITCNRCATSYIICSDHGDKFVKETSAQMSKALAKKGESTRALIERACFILTHQKLSTIMQAIGGPLIKLSACQGKLQVVEKQPVLTKKISTLKPQRKPLTAKPKTDNSAVESHPLYKTIMCRYGEGCIFGDRCSYAHNESEMRTVTFTEDGQLQVVSNTEKVTGPNSTSSTVVNNVTTKTHEEFKMQNEDFPDLSTSKKGTGSGLGSLGNITASTSNNSLVESSPTLAPTTSAWQGSPTLTVSSNAAEISRPIDKKPTTPIGSASLQQHQTIDTHVELSVGRSTGLLGGLLDSSDRIVDSAEDDDNFDFSELTNAILNPYASSNSTISSSNGSNNLSATNGTIGSLKLEPSPVGVAQTGSPKDALGAFSQTMGSQYYAAAAPPAPQHTLATNTNSSGGLNVNNKSVVSNVNVGVLNVNTSSVEYISQVSGNNVMYASAPIGYTNHGQQVQMMKQTQQVQQQQNHLLQQTNQPHYVSQQQAGVPPQQSLQQTMVQPQAAAYMQGQTFGIDSDLVPLNVFPIVDWLRVHGLGMYLWSGNERSWTEYAMHITPNLDEYVKSIIPQLQQLSGCAIWMDKDYLSGQYESFLVFRRGENGDSANLCMDKALSILNDTFREIFKPVSIPATAAVYYSQQGVHSHGHTGGHHMNVNVVNAGGAGGMSQHVHYANATTQETSSAVNLNHGHGGLHNW